MNCLEYLNLFNIITNTLEHFLAGKILAERNKTISVAESCTGGLLSSLLTDVSGSSSYIKANFVENKLTKLIATYERINE